MANLPISQLPAITGVSAPDLFVVVQGGVTSQVPWSGITVSQDNLGLRDFRNEDNTVTNPYTLTGDGAWNVFINGQTDITTVKENSTIIIQFFIPYKAAYQSLSSACEIQVDGGSISPEFPFALESSGEWVTFNGFAKEDSVTPGMHTIELFFRIEQDLPIELGQVYILAYEI